MMRVLWRPPHTVCTLLLILAAQGVYMSEGKLAGQPAHHRFYVQTAMRHMGVESHILWRKLLTAHPNPENAMIVEVGSYDGTQCVEAAKLGYGRVICLEPSPSSYARSKAAVDAAGPYKGVVSMLQLAGTNETGGEVEFHQLGDQRDHAGPKIKGEGMLFSHPGEKVMVKGQALDDLLKDETKKLWILKVDTQGFDGMVMKGALKTLRARKPINIMMELWPVAMLRAVPCAETLRDIIACGYKAYELAVMVHMDQHPSPQEIFNRPTSVTELCDWYEHNELYKENPYGYYTDIWFTDALRAAP